MYSLTLTQVSCWLDVPSSLHCASAQQLSFSVESNYARVGYSYIRSCRHVSTHRVSSTDDSMQREYIGVSELSHDGSLLEKLDSVGRVCQSLHSHVVLSVAVPPHTLAHTSKLTRAQVGDEPIIYYIDNAKNTAKIFAMVQF